MCGIAGYSGKSRNLPSKKIMRDIKESLFNRGPDGYGDYFYKSYGLVHTRLSIIDVQNGKQPIKDNFDNILVANGEIYNDLDIREEFNQLVFSTGSDNESILALYNVYGLDFVKHIRGMYSFALLDIKKEILILSRDVFGIKPLYTLETEDFFWFSSQPYSFIKAGLLKREENVESRNNLFAFQFIPNRETLLKNIKRVSPGETIVIKNGRIIETRILEKIDKKIDKDFNPHSVNCSIEKFDNLWMETLDRHRRSEVPIGLFLSGGIDSTAILSGMSRFSNNKLTTYTIGYDKRLDLDERDKAKRISDLFGVKHYSFEMNYKDFFSILPEVIFSMDDPVADYAIIPTYVLAKKISNDTKVVLSGEGGDELGAGYGRYRSGQRMWPFKKEPWSEHIYSNTSIFYNELNSWSSGVSIDNISHPNRIVLNRLQKMQFLDLEHWLVNDLLIKLDRCLMANGIEGRVPFLDKDIASFLFHLPDNLKIQGRRGKWIIRLWLNKFFPKTQPFDKKSGFSVPIGDWMNQSGSILPNLVADQVGVKSFCKRETVLKIFNNIDKKNIQRAWILLFYSIWHQCHIIGVSYKGNIFEVLSENS
ncbi:MAG: asparagine synthase (glutamine-hydrolyzing) [Pseudomonadota bacterium]|nr:asparagine synthase (glutamine-hydrolyzing) [Pseudomonadota bacterium]